MCGLLVVRTDDFHESKSVSNDGLSVRLRGTSGESDHVACLLSGKHPPCTLTGKDFADLHGNVAWKLSIANIDDQSVRLLDRIFVF